MCWSAEKPQKKLSDSTNSSTNTELNPLKVCCFFWGGESNESVMVLHHTPKIYELIHEGSVSTVTLNQLISMRWCQSPSSIWLELIDQANILLVQCPAFNECYLLHWWRGGRNKNHLLLSFPQMLQMEDWVSLNWASVSAKKQKHLVCVGSYRFQFRLKVSIY